MDWLTPGKWEGQKQRAPHIAQGLPVGKVQGKTLSRTLGCKKWLHSVMLLSKLVHLVARANVPALCQGRSTADVGKFEWLSIFMHWNIGQYGVPTNSISGMLRKCRVERSCSRHTNASCTSIWSSGSLGLYPTSRHSGTRTCCILYLISNQYYQKSSLIPWSFK
jgi:hypothetical protein